MPFGPRRPQLNLRLTRSESRGPSDRSVEWETKSGEWLVCFVSFFDYWDLWTRRPNQRWWRQEEGRLDSRLVKLRALFRFG